MRKNELAKFRRVVWGFYRSHKRNFPWRETANPYHILVSEIMLQQTQVARVIPKYQEFLHMFPSIGALAKAPQAKVVSAWQGLGYNRRALNLKKAAEIIYTHYKGKIPNDPHILSILPGIGKATAGAICAYAFNLPVPFIETNIRRVYLHHFFPRKVGVSDKELAPFIEQTVDTKDPRHWYWALMDYGSQLPKVVANPNRLSKHYTKQSKFLGSNRQKRGLIVKYLTEKGKATKTEINNLLGQDLSLVIEELMHEGFVKKKGNTYFL